MFVIDLPSYTSGDGQVVQALKIRKVFDTPRGIELHFEEDAYCPIEVRDGACADLDFSIGNYIVWGIGSLATIAAEQFEHRFKSASQASALTGKSAQH